MRLEMHVYRQWETLFSVCGEMWANDWLKFFTLEPARTNPVHPGHPCITAGRYQIKLTHSPHLGYVCPELLDVPERSAIRIHIGNYPKDVEGCTAVGTRHEPDAVWESGIAFEQLMRLLQRYDEIWVTYHDRPRLIEGRKDGRQGEPIDTATSEASSGAAPGI